jgi:hypothetical protein
MRKHFEPKADIIPDDPQTTLLEQNDGETISNIRSINHICIRNPILQQSRRDTSSSTPRHSTISITNPLNERNDNDDLSDLDLTNIPLRREKRSNKNPTDASLLQNTNHSLHGLSENPYVTAFKQQEDEARQKRINSRLSIGSETSDESCL